MIEKKLYCNLCLFDGEGGAAPAAGTGDAGAGDGKEGSYAAGKGRRASNPLADVVYGKLPDDGTSTTDTQAAAAGETTQTTSDTLEARKAEFEKMLSGEYKDLFEERIQKIINARFKETKNLEREVSRTAPILDMLAQKYGVEDPSDADALMKAIQEDNGFFEDAAANAGLTVEQYKHMQKMERENRELRSYRESAERQRQADRIYEGWLQEAEQLKNFYPSFNLQQELTNPQFGKMLGAGVGLKAAFEALHHDEIMTGAMQATARKIAKKTADGIASRQNRPPENGLGSHASAVIKSDVSKLTKEGRREIARRAARGEKISF